MGIDLDAASVIGIRRSPYDGDYVRVAGGWERRNAPGSIPLPGKLIRAIERDPIADVFIIQRRED